MMKTSHEYFQDATMFKNAQEYDSAFQCFIVGNALRRAVVPFDIEQDREAFSRLEKAFCRALPVIDVSYEGVTPIFVLGIPRSGTTLVEQILASHSEVHAAGELLVLNDAVDYLDKDFDTAQITHLRNYYLHELKKRANGEDFVIDKLPLNFKWIGFIALAMPEAKIVYLKRDARAVCFSNFCTSFKAHGNTFAYGLEDVAHYYNLHTELMDFWKDRFPGRIYQVNYETLTENQDTETRRLLDYIGLKFEPDCLAFHKNDSVTIPTASVDQVKKPMYQGSSDNWRKFEGYLTPMLNILSENTPNFVNIRSSV